MSMGAKSFGGRNPYFVTRRTVVEQLPKTDSSMSRSGQSYRAPLRLATSYPSARMRTGGYTGRYRTRGGETKFLDTSLALTDIATAGAFVPTLNAIPQDDTQSGRNGRKVILKSLSARFNLVIDTTNTTGVVFRVIFYLDKQCNGAAVTAATDLLTTANTFSFANMANTERFKILYDKVSTLVPQTVNVAGTSVNAFSRRFNFHKRCNIPITYDATSASGVIATIRSNNIGMLVLHNFSTATPDISGLCRIRYSD